MKDKLTIALAMSGGVDSSVVAYLLKSEGHDVVAFTMRHFQDSPPLRTTVHEKSIHDAQKVCMQLDIPHHIVDTTNEFHDIVIKDFIYQYSNGRTPNPCTLCNPAIKWGVFRDKIKEILAGHAQIYFATGHYARLVTTDSGDRVIARPTDRKKDQIYMLWSLSTSQIASTIFPLADITKEQTRQIANKLNLSVSEKKDSQDICFLSGKYTDFFLEHSCPLGDILFEGKKIIGKHRGIPFYTIGQRKGLPAWHSPLYVMQIDAQKNTITVTDDKNKLLADTFTISDTNWHIESFGKIPYTHIPDTQHQSKRSEVLSVQIRYRSTPVVVKSLTHSSESSTVTMVNPAEAITPGQSAVFYIGDLLVGGGIIQ
jgi:tRNA-specific 2-thiouridylase